MLTKSVLGSTPLTSVPCSSRPRILCLLALAPRIYRGQSTEAAACQGLLTGMWRCLGFLFLSYRIHRLRKLAFNLIQILFSVSELQLEASPRTLKESNLGCCWSFPIVSWCVILRNPGTVLATFQTYESPDVLLA